MDTRDLQTFIDVAHAGSFAEAARRRGLEPSRISRTVAALEHSLGFRLFTRTTRQLALTEGGRDYLQRVVPALEALELAREAGRDAAASLSGVLRVTASVAFGQLRLIPLLGSLRARYPELQLELLLSDANLDLVAEGIDVAIRLNPRVDNGYAGFPLLAMRQRVCASPLYVAAHGALEHPRDLQGRDCLLFPYQGYRTRWLSRDARGVIEEVPVRGRLVISSALGLLQACLDGHGPCLLGEWMVAPQLASGRLVDLFPSCEFTATAFDAAAWVLYPSRQRLPLKTRAFVDFLKAHIGIPAPVAV